VLRQNDKKSPPRIPEACRDYTRFV